MSAQSLEATMARLYADEAFRQRFLENPAGTLTGVELTAAELGALTAIDRVGLRLASLSFATKREAKARARLRGWPRVRAWLRRLSR